MLRAFAFAFATAAAMLLLVRTAPAAEPRSTQLHLDLRQAVLERRLGTAPGLHTDDRIRARNAARISPQTQGRFSA